MPKSDSDLKHTNYYYYYYYYTSPILLPKHETSIAKASQLPSPLHFNTLYLLRRREAGT